MKRKLGLILSCVGICALLFTGCSKNEAPAENTSNPSQEVSQQEIPDEIADVDTATSYIDKEELAVLFAQAQQIYTDISLDHIELDESVIYNENDMDYYKVVDKRFTTSDEFRAFLAQYFTTDFIEQDILSETNLKFTSDADGNLYMLKTSRAVNPLYAGHTLLVDKDSEKEVVLRATAYYATTIDSNTEEPFFVAPENPDDFTTIEFVFTLLKDNDAWRFDNFNLFY